MNAETISKRAYVLFLALLVVLSPLLVGSSLLMLRHGATFDALTPFWSDELYYWHQAQTFAEAGLEGGYYSVSETPARLGFSRFYTWGMFTPMLYGIVARLSEWSLNSIALTNVGFVTCALAAAVALMRLSWREMLLLAFVVATFLPLLLLLPSSMQDALHMAIAVVLGGAFVRLLNGQGVSRWGIGAFILGAVLLRPTWGLLLYPCVWLGRAGALSYRRIALEGLAITAVLGVFAWFFQGTGAPYPHFRTQFFAEITKPFEAMRALWDYFWHNVALLFNDGHVAARLQRVQIALLVVTLFGLWSIRYLRRQQPLQTQDTLFHLWNLLVVYGATMTLHEVIDGRDYRILASHLFLSLLVFVGYKRPRLALSFALSVCATVTLWLPQYDEWTAPNVRAVSYSEWQALQTTLADFAPYQPNENGWCNTVSHSLFYVVDFAGIPELMLAFDAGLGLSWINPERPPQTFKAGYLLLTDDDYAQWQGRFDARRLLVLPQGALYKNISSGCF